jgi:hypothetical protein
MPRVIASAEPDSRVYVDSEGALTVAIDPGTKREFAPRSLITTDRSAAVFVSPGSASIRVQTKSGMLVLTPNGYSIDRQGAQDGRSLKQYSAAAYRELGKIIKTDSSLQAAIMKLRKAAAQTLYGFTAKEDLAPVPQFAKAALKGNKRQTAFAKKPPAQACRVETVVEVVEREIEGWFTSVLTSGEQLIRCQENCLKKFPPLEKPIEFGECTLGCSFKVFVDIATKTWGVVDTITEEVVKEITHCTPDLRRYVGPWGAFDVPSNLVRVAEPPPSLSKAQILAALGPLAPVLSCLAQAAWTITPLGNIGVTIPGVDAIPLGVTVCIDRGCTDTLKLAFSNDAFANLIPQFINIFQASGIDATIAALGLGSLAAISVPTGVTIGQILLVVVLVLLAHALIVAGQLITLDMFGLAPNGVCLTYPALPGVLTGVINPVVGMVVLANTPVIVTPQ